MTTKPKKICDRCKLNRNTGDFYTTRLHDEDHPDGRINVCKICLGNNFKVNDPGTFMHVLRAVDHPWIPVEFKSIASEYSTKMNPNNVSILGRYISKMKLNQYSPLGFKDSMKAQASAGDESTFDDIENYAYMTPLVKPIVTTARSDEAMTIDIHQGMTAGQLLEGADGDSIDNTFGLTNEDIRYLTVKWGTYYSIEELVLLERKYAEMLASYEIETAMHRDYLKKLCSISMQYDTAIATTDIDSASKLSSMYSRVTKESGFQPSQNDTASDDFMDSVGHIVRMVEEQGPIPRHDITEDEDLVDITIKDLKMFNMNLVKSDDSIMERNSLALKQLEEQDDLVHRTVEEDEEFDYNDPLHSIDMADFDGLEDFDDRK